MTQNERVKEVRKSLGLTMEKFGDRVGVTKTAISNIESGNRNLTEQMTKSICREFGVSYEWLTNESGEMFVENDDEFLGRIDQIMHNEGDFRIRLFKSLVYADEERLKSLEEWIDFCADLKSNHTEKD